MKYIFNVGRNQTINISDIISKCLELDFIIQYHHFGDDEYAEEFDYFAEYILLSEFDSDIFANANTYIQGKLEKVKARIKSKLARKYKIIEYFSNLDYSLTDTEIEDYIHNNKGDIHKIKFNIIMENFMTNNLDYPRILFRILDSSDQDRESIYRDEIVKWYEPSKKIPRVLYDKYIRSDESRGNAEVPSVSEIPTDIQESSSKEVQEKIE